MVCLAVVLMFGVNFVQAALCYITSVCYYKILIAFAPTSKESTNAKRKHSELNLDNY